jgi:catechol 2,3-dioxygenase-like lactoylglutathione lyase family enzyme
MPVTGIHHVQLAMPPGGEDRARAFYGDRLGMTEMPKPPTLAVRGGCWFACGAAEVHLGVEDGFRPARKAHPALQVSGLAALVEKLNAAGHACTNDAPLPGYRRTYVSDPFGNRIELLEPGAA